jgi:hypothetical protein
MATVVQQTRGTKYANLTETSIVRDVSDRIALLQPEDAPLIAFINGLKKKKVATNPKFEWFEDELADNTVTNTTTGTGTSLTLTSGHGVRVRVGDLLVASSGEIILITAIATDTLTVTRNYGSVAAQNLGGADNLVIIGQAALEGDTNPAYKFTRKLVKSNYIQIFRDTVDITFTQDASESYGGDDRTHQRKMRGMEHKRSIEQAFLLGDAVEDTSGTQARRATGGLLSFIKTNITDAGGVLTEATFETFCRTLFRYSPSVSAYTKLFLCAPVLISALNFWNKSKLLVRQDDKTFGTRLATYRSGHGDLDVTRHWVLQDFTEFQKYGFAVDAQNLVYRYLKGLDTKLWVDIQTKDKERFIDEYRTHAGLQLAHERTHAILKNVTGYAA